MFSVPSFIFVVNRVAHKSCEDVWEDLICPFDGTITNTHLSGPPKELLAWHWKLCVSSKRFNK